jgi:hypothetical protein
MSDALSKFMAAIRSVESGGNYKAIGPPTDWGRATGAYQFIDSTWGGYKGYRSAYLAPKAVQDARAEQLMSGYYKEFKRWDLVAVAWHGGPGAARRAQRDPAYMRQISDGNLTTSQYVDRVMSRMGSAGKEKPKAKREETDLRPWNVPRNVVGKAGKIIIDPSLLLRMSRRMTEHVAIAESAFHRCHDAREEAGKIALKNPALAKKVRHALDEALEDQAGLRRLPNLLSRDVGYLVEARQRALNADDDNNARQRGTIGRLVGSMGGGHSKLVKSHVRDRLLDLFRKDTSERKPRDKDKNGHGLGGVNVGRAWGGTKSVFDQFITPFMDKRGLDAGSQKRPYDTVGGSGMSDHYTGNGTAYAVDYPTYQGLDDAKALAKAFGIDGWQPNSYNSHVVRIDGVQFRVQILWGGAIDHADHVHVGLRRA